MKQQVARAIATIVLGTTAFYSTVSFGVTGTNSGGGGTEIEAGFKAKVLVLVRQAQQLPPAQRAELKFDPFVLAGKMSMPNSMRPSCAVGTELVAIQKLNKMAYVFDPNSGVVYLDCTHYSLNDWKALFISKRIEQAPFFLHEALRVTQVENENDYGKSSSFIAAVMSDPQYSRKLVDRQTSMLLSREVGRCYIDLRNNQGRFAAFIVDGKVIESHQYSFWWIDDSVHRAILLGLPVPPGIYAHKDDIVPLLAFRDRALVRAADLGCF